MNLKTLEVLGPLHGYGIARRGSFLLVIRSGQKLLQAETLDWEQTAAIICRFFRVNAQDLS